jgi:hypothetical protein
MTASTTPVAHRAHLAVQKAIEEGSLIHEPCEICCSYYAVAHHDDYDRPLDVRWLCHKHHNQFHAFVTRRKLSLEAGWGEDFLSRQEAANLAGISTSDLLKLHNQLETVSDGFHRIYRASSVEKLIERLDRDLDAIVAAQPETDQ